MNVAPTPRPLTQCQPFLKQCRLGDCKGLGGKFEIFIFLVIFAGRPHRHSRVSGNPDGTENTSPLPPNHRRIPAYAGMTVGRPPTLYRRDSRLRGNDGRGRREG